MPSTSVLSIILIWVIFSQVLVVSIKKSKKKTLTFLNWEKQTWNWEKRWLFLIENGAEIRPLEKGRKSPEKLHQFDPGPDPYFHGD